MKGIIPYIRLHLYKIAPGYGSVLGLSSQPLRQGGVRCCDRHKGTGRAIDLEPLTNATAKAGSMGWVVHPDHTIREVLMHRQPVVHPS